MPLFADLLRQSLAETGSIHGVDRVEERYRVLCFVRLQWANEMQFDVRIFRKQWWPLCFRLLYAIFTENTLAGIDHGLDSIRVKGLRHCNQSHLCRIAPRVAASANDLHTNAFEAACSDNGHMLAISHRFADRHFK